METINNSHFIYTKFIGPTNHRGPRIMFKTFDASHRNRNKPHKKIINYRHDEDLYKTAQRVLIESGFSIVCMNDRSDHIIYVCAWDFEKLCKFFGLTYEI